MPTPERWWGGQVFSKTLKTLCLKTTSILTWRGISKNGRSCQRELSIGMLSHLYPHFLYLFLTSEEGPSCHNVCPLLRRLNKTSRKARKKGAFSKTSFQDPFFNHLAGSWQCLGHFKTWEESQWPHPFGSFNLLLVWAGGGGGDTHNERLKRGARRTCCSHWGLQSFGPAGANLQIKKQERREGSHRGHLKIRTTCLHFYVCRIRPWVHLCLFTFHHRNSFRGGTGS